MTPNDVKIVADNIDDFIEVPDGVARLRKAVLVLAASGKLVPQDSKEGSAENFYAQIQSDREKTGNGATGRSRKIHDFPPLTQKEIPYEIPSSWKWVRLGEIIEFRVGKTPPRNDQQYWSDAKVPWVSIADLKAGGTVITTKESINELALEKVFGGYIAPKGTLLFSFKLTIGKMSILGVDACHNEAIAAFFTINDTLRDYLFKILPAIDTTGRTSNAIKGKTLNSETLALIEIPLPPLSEQKRIVKNVEELMKQLDELEVKKQERDEMRARLARSAMQALGKGESKIAFEQLTELVKTLSDIKELENALLTLAVSGKLVPQSKADGTAENLYNQIQKERTKVENNSTARKKRVKDLAPIADDEIPFDIPKSWRWVRIGEVGEVKGGKRLPKGSGFVEQITNHPYIRITDMKNGSVNTSGVPYISDEVFEKISRYTISSEDIYVTIAGTIGDAGKIPKELDGANLTENAAKIEFKFIDIDFLVLALRSTSVKAQFLKKVVQMAQPKLALHRIESSIIPLPPLSEQKRIVKKVEELMILINKIKELI